MKPITLDHFIEERMLENRNLFSEEDFKFMNKNKECIKKKKKKLFTKEELEDMNHNKGYVKKIYLLGFIHAKECYDKQD